MVAQYGIPGLLSLLVMTPKLIASSQLLKRGKHAWGWGLALGIISCAQVWMFIPCCVPAILPLGAGVFTIVVVCLPHVRMYLAGANMPSGG